MIDNLLLCIGAQKSGTTWLHAHLKKHPEINFSHLKEVHYFNTIHAGSNLLTTRKVEDIKNLIAKNRYSLEKYYSDLSGNRPINEAIHTLLSPVDDDWYETLLRTTRKYAADFTPEYALLPASGFKHIKSISKKHKIIFIMRDPIERAKSAIQYYYKTQSRNIMTEPNENILNVAKKDFIVNMSKYESTINNLKYYFHENQILFLFFEDIMQSKQLSIDKVTDFLSIEKIAIPKETLEAKVNPSSNFGFSTEVDQYLKGKLFSTYEFVNREFELVPDKWGKA